MSRLFLLVSFLPDSSQDQPYSLFQGFNNNLIQLIPCLFRLASVNANIFIRAPLLESLRLRAYGLNPPGFGIIAAQHLLHAIRLTAPICDRLIVITAFPKNDTLESCCSQYSNVTVVQMGEDGLGEWTDLVESFERADASDSISSILPPARLAGHNIAVPNTSILQASRISVDVQPFFMSPLEGDYISEIVHGVNIVNRLRHEIDVPTLEEEQRTGIKLIVAAQGIFRSWERKKKLDTRGIPADKAKALRYIAKHILHPDNYSTPPTPDVDLFLANGELRPEIMQSVALRAPELRLFTAALSLIASVHLAPVIRLPPRLGKIRSTLRDVQELDERGLMGREEATKLSSMARDMGEKMRESCPKPLLDLIDKSSGHIKIVADIPLELMVSANGLPLMVNNVTSRLSVTPGDQLLRMSFPQAVYQPRSSDFSQVTVVRSFERADAIRPMAEQLLRKVTDRDLGIEVKFVDVEDADDFANAINSCKGAVVVYDGHGAVDRTTGNSYLDLATGRVGTYELRQKIRSAPPIVFLLACSTQSLDGSHLSVANGILSWSGVRTVIGTLGPVSGTAAAMVFSRFIGWLADPVMRALREPSSGILDWTTAFSIFQRRCYITDVLLALINYSKIGLASAQLIELQYKGNVRAFEGGDWTAAFARDVASAVGVSETQVLEEWRKYAFVTESLKYVQMGRPESIFLVPEAYHKADTGGGDVGKRHVQSGPAVM